MCVRLVEWWCLILMGECSNARTFPAASTRLRLSVGGQMVLMDHAYSNDYIHIYVHLGAFVECTYVVRGTCAFLLFCSLRYFLVKNYLIMNK